MKTIYSDDGISKALKGVFKRRHIPSYYHRLDEVDFVDACAETARGRLGYALFQDHVADELIDDMTMTQKIVFRATLDGIKLENDDIFQRFINEPSKDTFVARVLNAFALTCAQQKYWAGAKKTLEVYHNFTPYKGTNLHTVDILKYIHLIFLDLHERKFNNVPYALTF